MCSRVSCSTCGRPTYAGCGRHIEQVLGDVPVADRCSCSTVSGGGSGSSGGVLHGLLDRFRS